MMLLQPENPPHFIQTGRSATLGKVVREFTFREEELIYRLCDNTGEKVLRIPYDAIQPESRETITYKNSGLRQRQLWLWFLLCFIAILPALKAVPLHPEIGAVAVLIVVLAGSIRTFYKTSSTLSYTIFEASRQRITVIQDASHDEIIQQIKAHWTSAIRSKYGRVDLANPLEQEIKKFHWLKQKGVIDEQEYQEALRKLQAANSNMFFSDSKPSLN